MSKAKREYLKKTRMMKYFINATNEIIKKEGVGAVTIRKAAELAGYSSATLYNYFDNLSHLVFISTFNQLEKYNAALYEEIVDCKNSLEIYMKICKCFCDYAYEQPDIYENLFFTHNDGKFNDYIEQYYELFPYKDTCIIPKFLHDMLHSDNIYKRSKSMLLNCINEGFMDESEVDDFNDICLRFNKTILQDVKDGFLNKKEATDLTLRYYYKMLSFYIKPEFKNMLESIYLSFTH